MHGQGGQHLGKERFASAVRLIEPLLVLAAVLIFVIGCSSAFHGLAPRGVQGGITIAADSLTAALEGCGATVTISVTTPGGEQIFAYDDSRLMVPASVMKLVTAAEALYVLPRNFRWETELVLDGDPDSTGTLRGDLVIIGNRDPGIEGRRALPGEERWELFRSWVDSLKAMGVRHIAGAIYPVGRLYTPGGWEVGDLGERFAPVVSSLVWNNGLVSVSYGEPFYPGSSAEDDTLKVKIRPQLTVVPPLEYWTADHTRGRDVTCEMDSTLFFLEAREYLFAMGDSLTAGDSLVFLVERPVPDPRRLAGDAFRAALREAGITGADSTFPLEDQPIEANEQERITFIHWSAPLDSVIAEMLATSNNLHAELIRETVLEYGGEPLGGDPALVAMDTVSSVSDSEITNIKNTPESSQLLAEMGVDCLELRRVDGSGLSRRNNVSARTVTDLLSRSFRLWGDRWLTLLPRPGTPGSTVEDRLPDLADRLRIKTGSMSRTRSFAGFILQDGEPAAVFCILVNNCPCDAERPVDDFIRSLVVRFTCKEPCGSAPCIEANDAARNSSFQVKRTTSRRVHGCGVNGIVP